MESTISRDAYTALLVRCLCLEAQYEALAAEFRTPRPRSEADAALLKRCLRLEGQRADLVEQLRRAGVQIRALARAKSLPTPKAPKSKLDIRSPVKTCSTCKQIKPKGEFRRDTSKPDKLRCSCRTCELPHKKVSDKAWRERNPDYMKKWRRANRDRVLEYNRRQREKRQGAI